MAATYRASGAGGGTSGTGNRTVTVTTAVSGDLLIAFVALSGNTTTTPTMTDDHADGLGTWSRIGTALWNSSADNSAVFVRDALLGSTDTSFVITCTSGTNTAGEIVWVAVQGSARAGLSAIRSSGSQANQASGGTPAPALNQNALTANMTLAAVMSGDTTTSPNASWTERQDVSQSNPTTACEVCTRDSGFTSTTITFGATQGTVFASWAIEIDGTSPISATIAMSISESAVATGAGAITATAGLTLTEAAAATGAGAIAASISAAFAVTASGDALASASATVALTASLSGTATGAGAIQAMVPLTFTETATAAGDGQVSASVAMTLAQAAVLSGAISAAATVALAFGVTAACTGNGAVLASVPITISMSASMQGDGAMGCTIAMSTTVSSTASGSATIASVIGLLVSQTSTLTGQGNASAVVPLTITVSATGSTQGGGDVGALVALSMTVSADLDGDAAPLAAQVNMTLTVGATGSGAFALPAIQLGVPTLATSQLVTGVADSGFPP